MANTYTRLIYHCVWSTKNRAPVIAEAVEERIWAYLAGIAKKQGMKAIRIGGIENHVHVLVEIPKTVAVSEAMRQLKGGSAKWINEERLFGMRFSWQDGYGAFTVSPSAVGDVAEYIANQREHHRRRTFEEEYRMFLERHEVEFEEKYAFG
jgi:REP element-mobilizing transposase RayT